jgi:hypothetical protein
MTVTMRHRSTGGTVLAGLLEPHEPAPADQTRAVSPRAA